MGKSGIANAPVVVRLWIGKVAIIAAEKVGADGMIYNLRIRFGMMKMILLPVIFVRENLDGGFVYQEKNGVMSTHYQGEKILSDLRRNGFP